MSEGSQSGRVAGFLAVLSNPVASRRFVHWVILLAVSVASALLLSPGLSSQQLPPLTVDDLGRPYPARSLGGFKAGRDFVVADEVKTEQLRLEARARVRPVFDYDPTVEPGVKRGLHEAFTELQASMTVQDAAEKKPEPGKKLSKDELKVALKEWHARFETRAGAPEDEDLEVLGQARFSRELEQAAVSLVEVAYRAKVVASRGDLTHLESSAITVRTLGGKSEYEMATAPPEVHDLTEAAMELDRFASVPGNLLPESPPLVRRAVLRLARKQLRSNLTVNIAETEARRKAAADAVKPVELVIKKGERIIGDGELVNATHLLKVQGLRAQTTELDLLMLQLGGALIVAMLVGGTWLFFQAALRRFRPTRRDAAFMGLLVVTNLGFLHTWVVVADAIHDRYPSLPVDVLQLIFPLAAGAMLVRFVLSEESALFYTIVFSSLAGMMLGNSLSIFLFTLVVSLVGSERIVRAKDRAGMFRAGAITGGGAAGMVFFLSLASGKGLGADVFLSGLFAGLTCSFAVPMLVLALTPLVEGAFGYASDLKLLELANLNHPALKELVLQAPGTYHHSIIMGSLVEAAAESIGANPLLARSCAYYHDVGKGRNPAYFGENQKGENAHDHLAPVMSATIIKRHVTEGLEMARQYKLPQRVADAIPQHHGTRLVGYFFHKAQKELEGKDDATPVDEAAFRYPGPKPQSRETALVMIADAVEAASRSMADPNTEKLRALVQKLINTIFSEGQLDECDLTLKDLHLISESFVRTLDGIYHARPAYPAGALGGAKGGTEVVKPLALVKKDGARSA